MTRKSRYMRALHTPFFPGRHGTLRILVRVTQQPVDPPISRRSALGGFTVLLSGAIAALVGIPVVGALLAPLVKPWALKQDAFVKAIPLYELSKNPKRVELEGTARDAWSKQAHVAQGAAWVMKLASGEIVAFSTVCPHLGCSINKSADGFVCPCHTSAFALDGHVVGGPAPRGMDRLETRQESGWLWIRPARFKQGLAKPEEA